MLVFNNVPEDKDCRLHYVDFVGKHLPKKDGTFYEKSLYQDALHLNEEGAKLFAKELVHIRIFDDRIRFKALATGRAPLSPARPWRVTCSTFSIGMSGQRSMSR